MKIQTITKKAYGLPYMGSKNLIIKVLSEAFPKADHFYDLFGGGGAVTDYLLRNSDYKQIHYNDKDKSIAELFEKAVYGQTGVEEASKNWITREEFNAQKKEDALISIVWSFGTSGRTYLMAKSKEKKEQALFNAVVNDDYSNFKDTEFEDVRLEEKEILKREYEDSQKYRVGKYSIFKEIRSRTARIKRLEELAKYSEKLRITYKDYKEIEFEKDSVIYCDIPYENTDARYRENALNYKEFYDWACNQEELVLISSYEINDDRFQEVWCKKKRSLINMNNVFRAQKELYNMEKLYVPKTQLEKYKKMMEE